MSDFSVPAELRERIRREIHGEFSIRDLSSVVLIPRVIRLLRDIEAALSASVPQEATPADPLDLDALAALAKAIIDDVWGGPTIQRLVMTIDTPTPRNMGGWARGPFETAIYRVLVREAKAASDAP